MTAEIADTNILFYAHDRSAGSKHAIASALVARLTVEQLGAASIQVLQELYVNLVRKATPPLAPPAARAIIADLASWQIVEPTRADVLAAIDASVRWQVSFWDAMIIVAAQRAGATLLWSEDLNHGQDFDGVVVRNPFLETERP